MIKRTAKKALAFTLAAGMAFTAAPVAFPAATQISKAAEQGKISNITSVSFNLGGEIYNSFKADGLATMIGANVMATVEDPTIAGVALDSALKYADNAEKVNEDAAADIATLKAKLGEGKVDTTAWGNSVQVDDANANINVKALKEGTTKITLHSSDGATEDQIISIKVDAQESYFKVLDSADKEIADGGTLNVVAGGDVTAKLSAMNIKTNVDSIGVATDTTHSGYINSDPSVATVSYDAGTDTFTFHGVEAGTTQMSLYLNEDSKIFRFYVSVIAETEIYASIDESVYTYDGAWKLDGEAKDPVIFLDNIDDSAKITAYSNNGKNASYALKSGTNIVLGNDGSIAAKTADGKPVKGTSVVTVSIPENTETGQAAKSADITIIVNEEKASLVSVDVSSGDGEFIGGASAKVTGVDTYAPGNEAGDAIKLSTKDKKEMAFGVNANVKESLVSITSSDETVVKYDDGKLVALKAGTATVTVNAKPDVGFVDKDATVTFAVTVSDKNINNNITVTGAPIVVNSEKLTGKVNAKADYDNALTYPTLARKATSNDTKEQQRVGFVDLGSIGTEAQYDVTLNATTGEVTYKDNGKSGTIYVKVVGAANEVSEAPEPEYVEVQYGTLKDSELKVAANKVSVVAGSTVSAGATAEGQTITYASDDESIAVVAADGTITGVSAGTAVITVTAEANGVYKEATKTVTVVVTAKSTAKKSVVFKNTSKTYKAKTLKKSKKTFSVIKSSGGGKVTYKVTKGSKKYVKVSTKGVVTMKKGAKKGTYKVKVTVAAKGKYKKTSKTISVKVK